MSLTEKMATKIGNNAKLLLNADEDREQIIVYGAISLIQVTSAVLWVIIAGLVFGVFYEALTFSITISILRKYSGGAHASSPSRCIIIGTVSAVVAGILIDKALYGLNLFTLILISIAIMVFAFIIVVKNVPVDSINKPINNIEVREKLKKKSIMVVLISSLIIVILCVLSKTYSELYYIKFIESINLGILWQVSTLTKGGIRFLNKVDFVLKYMIKKGEVV